MIKVYKNGKEFLKENESFLNSNKYMTSLFVVDAKVLCEVSKNNFALQSKIGNNTMLAIKVEPYNLLLYGDNECLDELLTYLKNNNFIFKDIFCVKHIGDYLVKNSKKILNVEYVPIILMDFMSATEYTFDSSNEVEKATIKDANDIYDCTCAFIKDCGLSDIPNIEKIKNNISQFRCIKENNKIVSMAAFTFDTEETYRITHVYTKPEFRGKGYAKKVVNNIKNEILDMHKIPTLNVDEANPISNHVYESLGFKKIFTQGIYMQKNKECI